METILVFKVSCLYLHLNSYQRFSFYILIKRIMTTKWTIDADQSDVLIKMKDATITYLGGEIGYGSINQMF